MYSALLAVTAATVVARRLGLQSIYSARLGSSADPADEAEGVAGTVGAKDS